MNKNFLTFIFLIIIFSNFLHGKENEGLPRELPINRDTTLEEPERNATKAMLYSLLIPGGGQFYNKKYIKSAIEFTAETLLIGFTLHYHIKMNNAYEKYEQTQNQEDYNKYSNLYEKRQSMFWWLSALKFLSVIDSFVDAKLYNFDEKKKKIELRFEGNSVSLNYRF